MVAARKPLTALAAANARPKDKKYKLAAGGGLYLEVMPTGAKYWRWKYRAGGKEKRLALGVFPEVSLSDARQRRDEAKAQLRAGTDPAVQRKTKKLAVNLATGNSFEAIAREWLQTKENDWSPKHFVKVSSWFRLHVFPYLGDSPVGSLDAPEILAVLKRLVKRGTLDSAIRVREVVSAVFRYAIATGRAQRDPAAALKDALPRRIAKNYASITKPAEIGALLRAIDGYQGNPVTLAALQLSPLLFQRPGELRGAKWSEIDFEAAEWRIPPARQKLRKSAKESDRTPDHIVPLSTQALAILRELYKLTGNGRLVFPGDRSVDRPISENTVNAALRRLDYTKEQMTGHGFRHLASTNLNELGWNPDAIERQLAHKDSNAIRGTYNLAGYLDERRKMMQAWADHLDALRTNVDS